MILLEVLVLEVVAAYEVAVAPTIVTTSQIKREHMHIVREHTLPQLVLAAARTCAAVKDNDNILADVYPLTEYSRVTIEVSAFVSA
jgi:hypothetical protein